MKRFVVVTAFLGLGLALPVTVSAQDKGEDDVEVFDFEEDTLTTDYLKPNTFLIDGLGGGRQSSLIKVRLDFVAEIVKSAEDI